MAFIQITKEEYGTPADLQRAAEARARLRGRVTRPVVVIPKAPVKVEPPQHFYEEPEKVVTLARPPHRLAKTIYFAPIGPVNNPKPVIYSAPIGPKQRDWLDVESGDFIDAPRRSFREILQSVCDKYNVTPADVTGSRRMREVIVPRLEIYYRCRQETSLSMPQIARRMGGRDHSTICSGVRRYQTLLDSGKVQL